MINSIFKKSNWMALLPAGILFSLLAASPVYADYAGHVASFKSEKNAIVFIHKMKAKGLVAYYEKEDIPGKGTFYRSYIGGYKTLPLAQKALAKLKESGEIDYFNIQKVAEKKVRIAAKKTEAVERKNEPAKMPENKTEAVAQKNKPTQKAENKTEIVTQKNEPVQKSETKIKPAGPKKETAQKPERTTEIAAQKNEPVQKSENKTEMAAQENEPTQEPENKTAPSIDTGHYYDGIKGIVLKNGKIIRGQIISVDDNDVLKIRTRSGKILSYSFTKDVKKYITRYEP
jgi:outer membrane biosynthesis protein TonB